MLKTPGPSQKFGAIGTYRAVADVIEELRGANSGESESYRRVPRAIKSHDGGDG
jgi:hypothetical protein